MPEEKTKKTVLLGVTGSIAAYKAAQLCSNLCKRGYDVQVVMTRSACELIRPITFETLSNNRVSVEQFERNFQWNVQHISLAKKADLCLVAPATANMIAKMACGIADDMLSSTLLAARAPKIICPAMNTGMYENFATVRNIKTLQEQGALIVQPDTGFLACGDTGKGRLADLDTIEDAVSYMLVSERPLAGKRVLVTAGATREALDPVRFLTNHSSGKMGYAVARAARNMGAAVTLVSSGCALADPFGVEVVRTVSAGEMLEAVKERQNDSDIIIKAAAVADYRPKAVAAHKMKKSGEGEMTLALERTTDILAQLCKTRKAGQLICGFSMETENLVENSRAKLQKKGCDMIVANSLCEEGAGFGGDTNVAALITKDAVLKLPKMSKDALAEELLQRLLAL